MIFSANKVASLKSSFTENYEVEERNQNESKS